MLLYGFGVRICIVARVVPTHGIGGMQDHTVDLARGLVAAGHEVEVITGRHPEGLHDEEWAGVRWHYVDAPTDDFTNREWRERSYELFVRTGAAQAFDLVHSEGSSGLELVRRGVHQTIPFVVMFHGNFLSHAKASLHRQVRSRRLFTVLGEQRGLLLLARRHFAKGNWRLFRSCEAIVPSRQQLADTCRSHRLDPARVHVVPNGVDASVFRPRPREETRAALDLPEGFLFVCAGRIGRDKGIHHALNALALVRERLPDVRLLIVGDGPERGALERQAWDLGMTGRVIFAGAQMPDRMPAYIAAADAFLFPTELNEALPLVLLQAMACGLPVVASRIGAIPEVVDRPGKNGLLVPPGDAQALAAAAATLRQDEDFRRQLGLAARRRVLAEYTAKRMTARTLAVYEIAAARPNPGTTADAQVKSQ